MHAAIAEEDTEALMAGALDFHRRIVMMSKNRLFLHAWDHLAWDVRVRIAARHIGVGSYVVEREPIVAALRAGDGARAGLLLRRLIESFLAQLNEIERRAEAVPSPAP
jgi:DNA-binding GntR family transcriptional regulator